MAAIRLCSVEGCRNRHLARELCRGHYERLTKYGSALAGPPVAQKIAAECLVAGCCQPVYGKGYCISHWTRLRRHGSPEGGAPGRGHIPEYIASIVSAEHGDECLTWPFSCNAQGYGVATDARGKRALASRIICEAVHGPAPTPDHEAAHSCGKGHEGCINPDHLRWATRAENVLDAWDHGTMLKGSDVWCAKLTPEKVRQIRGLFGKRTNPEIGDLFGVTGSTVWAIQTGRTWRWVT